MQTKNVVKNIARGLLLTFAMQFVLSTAQAVDIPTGPVDFGGIAVSAPSLNSAPKLVKWRTGTANAAPIDATQMSFAYLTSGSNLPIPSRANPKDNSANDQGNIWSDNAISVDYKKGNQTNAGIIMYTNNTIAKLGGLVNSDQTSVLPLIWKAADIATLQADSDANVDGSKKLTNALFMPTEIASQSGGTCVAEGPYAASTRASNGFCDYSVHYMMDKNQASFFANVTDPTAKMNAFKYASLIGPNGVNESESGNGSGNYVPMHAVLGVNATSAQAAQYSTTITVEVASF